MAYLVLARKYRPQTFAEVVGQEHVVRTLKNAIKQARIAHAFLFSGIRGVGKTTIARILAKAINCEEGPREEPCNQCLACREITEGRAVDVQEIDAASNRGIDEIRDLRENIKFRPSRLRSKVYIIDEAHMLTREAFNALLKTLEEPPPHVHFILATTEPHKIPLTILSRCQRYEFRRLSLAKLVEHMEDLCRKEGVQMEREALETIAREAEGSVRDALSLLDQAISSGVRTHQELLELFGLADRALVEEISRKILAGDLGGTLSLFNQAFEQGVDLIYLFEDLVTFFRHLLAVKSSERVSDLPESELAALRELSLEAERETMILVFEVLLQGFERARRSPVPKMVMELALAKACEAQKVVPLAEILAKLKEFEDHFAASTPSPQRSSAVSPEEGSPRDWASFVAQVKETSPSLGAIIEGLDPPRPENGALILSVPSPSLLEEKEYQDRLRQMARERLGAELRLEFASGGEAPSLSQSLKERPVVQEALKIFGGRIAGVKIYEKE